MNGAARLIFCFALIAPSTQLRAATIFTQDERHEGEIISQNKESVVLRKTAFEKTKSDDITLMRDKILTIYDDEYKLIWSHPSIAKPDSTLERKEKLEIDQADSRSPYKGWHVGLSGGLGIGYGNATFSSYPLSTGPDYRTLIEVNASAAWYYSTRGALVFGVGGSQRSMPIKGINAANLGAQGNGYWPMQFVDVRAAYRFQSDIFFVELGVLAAIKTSDVPLTVETTTSTTTGMLTGTAQKSYAALSLALGANIPVATRFYIFVMARIDHGVTQAVTGDLATAQGPQGQVLSTAPMSLVPLSITGQLGVAYRL